MGRTQARTIDRKPRLTAFALTQLVVLPAIAMATFWSQADAPRLPDRPNLRTTPHVVAPLYDYPLVINDDQLRSVLTKLRPPRTRSKPKINHVDHALRFWGAAAEFNDREVLSGRLMKAVLTRDDVFRKVCGSGVRPLLMTTRDGLRFRTQEGSATSSHVDHSLASLAEVGLRLDETLVVRTDETLQDVPVSQVVLDAAGRFGLNQQEYEWTALVLGLYGQDFSDWRSSDGERITMDRIAERIMRQDYGQGCCYGGHRLFTLTMLLRLDETEGFFSDRLRRQVQDHLIEATCRLVNSQSPEGYWGKDWPGELIGVDDELGLRVQRLLATGHALEWWAMAPAQCQPPRECVIRAAQWLVAEIEKMDATTVEKNYTFLTHAGRALVLWRGDFAASTWDRLGREIVSEDNL